MARVDDGAGRTMKYRFLRRALWLGNRLLIQIMCRGLPVPCFAVLETTGRRTGQPRRTAVGNGLAAAGDTFWLVAAHGDQADYVRNLRAHPQVRILLHSYWRTGTATALPDDDTRARSRTLPYQWDAAVGRTLATTPLTIRIDLEPPRA